MSSVRYWLLGRKERKFPDREQEPPSQMQAQIQVTRASMLPVSLKEMESVLPSAAYD